MCRAAEPSWTVNPPCISRSGRLLNHTSPISGHSPSTPRQALLSTTSRYAQEACLDLLNQEKDASARTLLLLQGCTYPNFQNTSQTRFYQLSQEDGCTSGAAQRVLTLRTSTLLMRGKPSVGVLVWRLNGSN